MQNIKQLIKWAKIQSRNLQRAAQKPNNLPMSNIYMGRSEWIDWVLLPKLKEFLHTPTNSLKDK